MLKYEKDLKWFLFEEYLENLEKLGFDIRSLSLDNLKYLSKRYKNPILNLIIRAFRVNYLLFSPLLIKRDKKTFLFQNGVTRYDSIINSASTNNVIVMGIEYNALKNFVNKKIMYYPFDKLYESLYLGWMGNNENWLYKSLDELKKLFEYIDPDVIILNDDALPESRAMFYVGKELGIPTIEIQHGLYQSAIPVLTGKYVDHVFVWGEYFKKIYIKNKVNSSKIKILGYPYEIKDRTHKNRVKKVVYLGQNFEVYDKDLIHFKKESLSYIDSLCNNLEFIFFYRPHPGDDVEFLKSELPHINFISKNEKLQDTFDKGDIFISFSSTSLVEAALRSKICIQLKNYPLKTDNFQELGICPSFDDFSEMEMYIKEVANAKDSSIFRKGVDSEYIEIPKPDPGNRFLELVEDII